jgi:CRP/FNR family cyclic AMP-dependent transcriptional regulator
MDLIDLLQNVQMFEGLTVKQLKKIAYTFNERILQAGEILFSKGDKANYLSIVKDGFIEVVNNSPGLSAERVFRNLGFGQTIGEMSWIDRGVRSATVRSVTNDTILVVAPFESLDEICNRNPKIGYRVFRNIAADLSFRFRQDSRND